MREFADTETPTVDRGSEDDVAAFGREVDVLVIACGFDGATGSITQIDIRGLDGTSIKDKWTKGVYTNLGIMTANFPNSEPPFLCAK